MIKIINDINEHLMWLEDYLNDHCFSSPFCDKERVISLSKKANNVLLGAYEEDKLVGIFCLLIINEEKYIETMFMYCKVKKHYEELFLYLNDKFCGYEVWFLFNPNNNILKELLLDKNAYFYTEQRFMDYQGKKFSDIERVIPYSASYKDEYIKIHTNDGYWNGEKMLEKIDKFDIFLFLENDCLVGYIDISKGSNVVEIMDIFVLPEYRNSGIGSSLLRKAISFVGNKRLILTVDVDNNVANHLYEKIGFKELKLNNCITAKYRI